MTPAQPVANTAQGTDAPSTIAPPGLKGLVVADTTIGSVRGDEGYFHYRQYDAAELARTETIETVWHLLIEGALPDSSALDIFTTEIGQRRVVDDDLLTSAAELGAAGLAPHHALISLIPRLVPAADSWLDIEPAQLREQVLTVAAATPTLLAAVIAGRSGREPLQADPAGGHAADWLRMASGSTPTDPQVRMLEAYLTATIDHGFNASTFVTRATTSTGADAIGALCAGVAALSGPLHGGAPSRAFTMIDEIGDPSDTRAWVLGRLDRGEKIMGFGHAVYRADDPRSLMLRDVAEEFGGDLVQRAVAIEREVLATLREWKPGTVIVTNVEYYAGIVMHLAGLPTDLFTPSFTVSRIIGWGPHILEQAAANKIMRPKARYVGPTPSRGSILSPA